eukprot:COSAG04_NODE_1217_length_7708_cov_2.202260_2_plen_86_part_00
MLLLRAAVTEAVDQFFDPGADSIAGGGAARYWPAPGAEKSSSKPETSLSASFNFVRRNSLYRHALACAPNTNHAAVNGCTVIRLP